jgi:hypothetical protein
MKPMMAMRPTLRTLLPAVLACTVLAGCGEAPSGPTSVTASVARSRAAQARGQINVLLSNPTDRPVQVRSLALDDLRFAPVPATRRLVTIRPHAEGLLVPLTLGAPRCIGVLGEPHVVAGRTSIPVDDAGRRVLDGIVEDACVLAAVHRSVSLDFLEEGTPVSDVAVDVVLRLQRRGSGRVVTVDAVGSNVIFAVSSDDLPATLAGDDDRLEVTVRFSAERCEPHALAESKKTYQFPAWVTLDDAEPAFVELTVTGGARAALDRALNDGCAG